MPKIVDHDQRREEIALKAAGVFLEFGYKELGMRQLCSHLNMSKSAVYHYYKSKDELFKAATEAIVRHDGGNLADLPLAVDATAGQKIENFFGETMQNDIGSAPKAHSITSPFQLASEGQLKANINPKLAS